MLGVGKHLSPRLYVGYGVSLLGTGQVVMLKYLLRKGFDVQIESSTLENRASLNWRKEKSMSRILQTERLNLREINELDAPFILELLTDPSFLRHIGDRGVHDLESAVNYIRSGPGDSYARNGYGLWLVELKESHVPIGICGLCAATRCRRRTSAMRSCRGTGRAAMRSRPARRCATMR